ncbi:MAG: DUF362 domain-containing protein [Candidatus Heimdallarchaeota archaeon]
MESFDKWLKEKEVTNKRIFLKPNVGYPKPYPYTTSLELIKSVVKLLAKYKPKEIVIGEGSTSKSSALDNFATLGFIEELSKYQVKFIDLNACESSEVKLSEKVSHYLPVCLMDFDVRISVPVIKFYEDEQKKIFMSNAIKNFFGLPPKDRYHSFNDSYKRDKLHDNLHKSVMEIFLAVEQFAPFDLYICDGLEVLYGEASIGNPQEWGKLILADNALEADLKVIELLDKSLPEYLEMLVEKK